MNASYEFLIQYVADLAGITQAKGELRKLEVYNQKFGASAGQVTQVLSKNISQSTRTVVDGTTQATRNVQRVFQTASGQIYTYSRAVTTSGGTVVRTTDSLKKGFGSLGQGAASLSQKLTGILSRAALTIPVWLVLRTVVMGVIRTISDSIQAFIELDDELSRIKTVMFGTAEAVDAEMAAIKTQIIDMSLNSRISLKDLAEGFYFLKTANLSAVEAMAAFAPTVNLAIGTMNNMGQSARAVAGIYNTMGNYLGENLTVHEKFQKIADVLAYTYTRQDVQLDELINSYMMLAPYITGLSDNFLELTTMLGFLNTRLLRGGRTGRLTGQAIIQLTQNAEVLGRTLGITFDPNKPIALLDTVGKIRDALKTTGKVTAEQGQILNEVFRTRGGVAIRLLIEHFDDLNEEIKLAVDNADGFAQKIKEIRMDTIAAQMERMKNITAILTEDFLTTAYGAKNLADAVRLLNESLLSLRPAVQGVGKWFGDAGEGFRIAYYWIRAYNQAIKEIPTRFPMSATAQAKVGEQQGRRTMELFNQMYAADRKQTIGVTKQRDEYEKSQEQIKKYYEELLELGKKRIDLLNEGREEEAKAIEKTMGLIEEKITKLQPAEIQLAKLQNKEKEISNLLEKEGIGYLDKIEEKEKSRLRIMKELGVSDLDIAKAELEILENRTIEIDRREEELEIMRAQLKITEEEIKYGQEMTNVIQQAEIDMLRAAGASEIEILRAEEKRIRSNEEIKGSLQTQLELGKLQVKQAIAIQNEKKKELDTAVNIALAFGKADEFEKNRLRRIAELVQFSAEDLAQRYRTSAFDRGVIDDYIGYLNEEQKQAVGEMAHEMYRLPGKIKDLKLELLPRQEIFSYWEDWTNKGITAGNIVATNFRNVLPAFGVTGATTPAGVPTPPTGEWMPSPATSRAASKVYTAVTKEGQTYVADSLERLEQMLEREGLMLEELKGIKEAIENGTLKQGEIKEAINRAF